MRLVFKLRDLRFVALKIDSRDIILQRACEEACKNYSISIVIDDSIIILDISILFLPIISFIVAKDLFKVFFTFSTTISLVSSFSTTASISSAGERTAGGISARSRVRFFLVNLSS
jgi:hypothetical protein